MKISKPTGSLRPNEQAVLDAFTGVLKLTVSELEKKTGLRNVVPVVASLMAKGAVEVSEEFETGLYAENADLYPSCRGV